MRKFVLAALLCLVCALPAAAQGPYIGVGGGLSMNHDSSFESGGLGATLEYDLGYGFNAVAGYNFEPVRVEAEFGYRKSDVDKVSLLGLSVPISGVDLTTMSYMANVYYDVKTETAVMPFFGVGLGVINGELDDNGDKIDDTVFGYQLTAGITGALNKNFNLDCYYRFQGAASDFEKNTDKYSYTNSTVFVGMRYTF